MSIVLSIDCAFPQAVVAIQHGEVTAWRSFGPQRSHALRLISELQTLLDETDTQTLSISRIGVGQGPGSFTGLRVALSTATGLSQAHGAELVGFSTFEALPLVAEPTLFAFDARQGMVYAGVRSQHQWIHEPAALSVVDAITLKTDAQCILGNAADRYPELKDNLEVVGLENHADPHRCLQLTHQAQAGQIVLPTYKEGAQAQRLFGSPNLGRALDADELKTTPKDKG